jgi:hypothetical protein
LFSLFVCSFSPLIVLSLLPPSSRQPPTANRQSSLSSSPFVLLGPSSHAFKSEQAYGLRVDIFNFQGIFIACLSTFSASFSFSQFPTMEIES